MAGPVGDPTKALRKKKNKAFAFQELANQRLFSMLGGGRNQTLLSGRAPSSATTGTTLLRSGK